MCDKLSAVFGIIIITIFISVMIWGVIYALTEFPKVTDKTDSIENYYYTYNKYDYDNEEIVKVEYWTSDIKSYIITEKAFSVKTEITFNDGYKIENKRSKL